MSVYISAELRQQLENLDEAHCAYCRTSVDNSGQPLTVDHILPLTHSGKTELMNLCLACRKCNEFKGDQITAIDPLMGETISLFHPRQDYWQTHFQWDETGTRLIGLTPTGRATIVALKMNNEVIVSARRRWVSVGWHPPDESGAL
jgi:hypothetical protein